MKKNNTIIRKITQLASHINNNDILTGLLIIRQASPNYIPTFTQMDLEDYLHKNQSEENSRRTPWYNVAHAPDGMCIAAMLYALRSILPSSPLLYSLEESIKFSKSDEAAVHRMIDFLSAISIADISLPEIHEICLSKQAWNAPVESNRFHTPSYMAHLILGLLDFNKDGNVYDPCCDNGTMLCQISQQMPQTSKFHFYGQATNQTAYRMCHATFFLHDISVDLGDRPANTLLNDIHIGQSFDYILANPPFNLGHWCGSMSPQYDIRWQYGPPPRSNANYAWLQHIISHLSEQGRAAVILSNGTLTTQTREERSIRQCIIRDGLVGSIIALPPKLFYGTKIPCCIWLLDKSRESGSTTLFIDARQLKLTTEKSGCMKEIHKLAELVQQHRSGTLIEKTNWYAVATLKDIEQKGFVLSPNFYTQTPAISLKPIKKNRLYFTELINKLNHRLGNHPLSGFIQQWSHVQTPNHWGNALLPELFQIFGGLAKDKAAFGHGIPMVGVKTVIKHAFLPDRLPSYVDATEVEVQKYCIKAGDILLNRTSETVEELACCCIAATDQNAVYGNYVKRLRLIETEYMNPFYMIAYFHSAIYRQEVEKVSPVYTTRANMNVERLSKIRVYYPDTTMQKKIGDTLFAIFQFLKDCCDSELVKLLNQFMRLLIEQVITYPVLCSQKEEVYDR